MIGRGLGNEGSEKKMNSFGRSKLYKLGDLGVISNFRIVSMSPSNLLVAGCLFLLEEFYG